MTNTYQDTPISNHTLASDQPRIEGNFLYVAQTLGTAQPNKALGTGSGDHQISIGGTDAVVFEGRHVQVSFKDRSNANLPMPGDGTDVLLWASGGNLFYKNTTLASGIQITNSASGVPVIAGNGFSFLPGGAIIQWGNKPITAASTLAITFPLNPFPTAVFSCVAVSSIGDRKGAVTALTTAGFTYFMENSGTGTVYFFAIGN